jgi:hypothetical protein
MTLAERIEPRRRAPRDDRGRLPEPTSWRDRQDGARPDRLLQRRGVAIAITLLVIEIHAPGTAEHDVAGALVDLVPQFLSFALSFFVIGQFWAAHHRMFRYISRFDLPLVWINLGLLFCIAFLPFPTELLGLHDTERVAVIFYTVAVFVTGMASAAFGSTRRSGIVSSIRASGDESSAT